METVLTKIDELVKELKSLQPLKPEYQQKLDKKFRLEFNFNSNHIEGNTLTYGETELLLIFDKTTGNHEMREYEEMKSHDVALEMIRQLASDQEHPLTEAFIKELNKIILVRPFWKNAITADGQNTRREIKVGDYKEFPNSVRLANGEIFEYASPTDTPILMAELMAWYRDELEKGELHPIALAALLHYKFVCIHPFDDGNGRISRLLMNYVLLSNDLPPVIIKSSEKSKYLNALNQADTGNINAFISYIAEQMIWSLELSLKAAKGENIDEHDDLDKEIAIWKKQIQNTGNKVMPKSDKRIYELYQNGIRQLFELFIEKSKQFDDLFAKKEIITIINGNQINHQGDIKKIDEHFKHILDSKNENNDLNFKETNSNSLHSLTTRIIFRGFQENGTNTFDQENKIRINFLAFKYEITLDDKLFQEFLYNHLINQEDTKIIVNQFIQKTFEEIKAQIK